ncbi:response regulator [Ktedonosporobacter rubrisoli]|nr:response regulator [Ktedonosporobacter rubrisoli]
METQFRTGQSISPPEQPMGDGKTIMIVEDDVAIGSMLVEMLRQETCYRPVHVTTGEQALSAVSSVHPHLLLLDYRLPDMTGINVYTEVMNNQQAPPPAIMMSACFPTRLLATDRLTYLQKPFELDLLLEKIDQLVESEEKKI